MQTRPHNAMHLPSKFGVGLSLFLNWTSFQSLNCYLNAICSAVLLYVASCYLGDGSVITNTNGAMRNGGIVVTVKAL